MLKVVVKDEAGYWPAMEGLALNKKQTTQDMPRVAEKLAHMDGGHNKFLESIVVWLRVTAPRYWWQEADTYRVGSTKQSESTMHTMLKRPLTQEDFDQPIPQNWLESLNEFVSQTSADNPQRLTVMKSLLPEGFIQTRMWCVNYKTLRNIILQRRTHRLKHWREFISQVLEQVQHPELLPSGELKNE